jgi:hypothetical protein
VKSVKLALMKRFFKWIIMAVLASSLASCGLPGAAVRSVSNTAKSMGGMAKALGGSAAGGAAGAAAGAAAGL